MDKQSYKRLGGYIRAVDVRNRELQCSNLLGLSIAKKFIPSIANTIGTDLSTYKIVQNKQFAYVPVTSRNGDKITIALYNGKEDCIVSQAYTVFEIADTKQLLPEYLMMWFQRPEFDRYARFKSIGSAREVFDWNEMCDVLIPLPSVAEQEKIVSQHQAIENRINTNETLVYKLEETAIAIYKNMFVENIDTENLPDGWKKGVLSDVAKIIMGQSPDGESLNTKGDGIIFYQGKTDFGFRFPSVRMFTTAPKKYAAEGDILISVRAPVGDINIAQNKCSIGRGLASVSPKFGANSYVYYLLKFLYPEFNKYNGEGEGTVFGSINGEALNNMEIIVPTRAMFELYNSKVSPIDNHISLLLKEIEVLKKALKIL